MTEIIPQIKLFGEDIPWLEGMRNRARKQFVIPTNKTEAWKYTGLKILQTTDFVYAPSKFLEELEGSVAENCENHHCQCHDDNECSCGHHEAEHCHCGGDCHSHHRLYVDLPFSTYQIHFYNGKFVPYYPAMPAGVEVMTLMQAVVEGESKNYLGKYIVLAKYPFAALNTALLEEGIFIRLERNQILDKPLMLVYHCDSELNLAGNIHNLFIAENGASAEVIEYYLHTSANQGKCFNNIVNEFYLAPKAQINHCKLQCESPSTIHIALNYIRVKAEAKYNGFCLQKGGILSRNETKVDLLQPQAQAEVNVAYKIAGPITVDTTTDVEHLASQTFSEQLVRGVVGAGAHGVFQGKISIVKDAQETEGHQLHEALLLSDDAEIDVKPELEIFADNVKCSHGAACGELDNEQIFYMRSRGIGEDEAKQILTDAYLAEVVAKIANNDIREWVLSNV